MSILECPNCCAEYQISEEVKDIQLSCDKCKQPLKPRSLPTIIFKSGSTRKHGIV